ncbi:hypothetical protein METP3_00077 [Methanosarcinales archaeon]|nr:hypothetical protein METP3_00077 [Methanosarcinales archaeon]
MTIDLENDSKYQEQLIEYKFVSELMISLAFLGKKLEVLRVHTDAFGYDLILKVDEKIKYVQLKSRKLDGKAKYWNVHKSLLSNNQGIILVIFYSLEKNDLKLFYNYLDFNKYNETKNTEPKYKKDHEKYCKVSKKDMIYLDTIHDLAKILFFKEEVGV